MKKDLMSIGEIADFLELPERHWDFPLMKSRPSSFRLCKAPGPRKKIAEMTEEERVWLLAKMVYVEEVRVQRSLDTMQRAWIFVIYQKTIKPSCFFWEI